MTGYVLTERAASDLTDIWDYIAEDSIDAADRVVDGLFSAFALLATMPNLGRMRSEWTDKPVRFFVVDNYHVVYDPRAQPLAILTILHGARNIPETLTY